MTMTASAHSSSRSRQGAARVVVVGGGNAALVAALSARESGAEVLVLEAAPQDLRGGNSRFTGGIFRVAHGGLEDLRELVAAHSSKWFDRVDVPAYPQTVFAEDMTTTTAGRAAPDLQHVLIDESLDTVRWMHGKGVQWELAVGKLIDPNLIDDDTRYRLPGGGALRAHEEGVGLIEDLYAAVAREGIEVRYSSPVVDLVMEGNTCKGVVVRGGDRDEVIDGVVILASGGFESNPQMRQRWLGPGWDLVKVRGTRFNMGVPLEAAMRQGAQPFGHWGGCHAVPLDHHAPDWGDLRYTDKFSRYSYPYSIMVNVRGERFVDEGEDEVWLTYAKTGDRVRTQPGARAAQIFDSKTVHLLEPRYSTGRPVTADTIGQLAVELGVTADTLVRTVEDFNRACADGEFDPFTKDSLRAAPQGQPVKSNWAQPIDTPPFTAYEITCGITFTFGGLRTTPTAEVVDTAQRTVTGLYATGEITGGFFYLNYPAGAGLTRGAVFGRIAGREAAALAATRVGNVQ
ncbi:FAD-dependent tricarballylate dehydrogenase TcuA [Intrasporangium sp. DVR]|uniref:FAD-dependent tricarballylate dehydrogenase TcuA n=1 Tax=Intrasporangium sp. DVR TaxID=3127867 RepID=UPI00313A58F8